MLFFRKREGVQSIAFNAGFLIFSRSSEKAIRFVYVIILARYLGPELLGLYNYGLACYLIFLPLSFWGIGILLSINLGKIKENEKSIIATTLVLRLLTSVIAAAICIFTGWIGNEAPFTFKVVTVFSIALVGRSIAVWTRECFTAKERSQYSAGLEISFRFLEFTLGTTFLLSGGGLLGLCVIHGMCWFLEALTGLRLVWKQFGISLKQSSRKMFYQLAYEAVPVAINAFFFEAQFQIGLILLKGLASDKQSLGYYSIAFQLVANTVLLPMAFGKAAMPVLSRANDRGAKETIIFLQMMLKLCALFSTLLVCGVVVFNTPVIRVLFGVEYLDASQPLILCAIAMMFYYALTFANSVLNAGKKYSLAALSIGAALIVNVLLTVIFSDHLQNAPAVGLIGGASVALIGQLVIIHQKIGKVDWYQSFFKPYVIAVGSVLLTWQLRHLGIVGFLCGFVLVCVGFTVSNVFTAVELGYVAKFLPVNKTAGQ